MTTFRRYIDAVAIVTASASFVYVILRAWDIYQVADSGTGNTFIASETATTILEPMVSPFMQGIAEVTGTQLTRGLRNNNPGNIRQGDNWEGLTDPQTDPTYCTFISMEYGVRALAKTLGTYHNRYGLHTVRQIITRWAPPNENDTAAYIAHVCEVLSVGPDDTIDWDNQLSALIRAITLHENSYDPITTPQMVAGIQMAEMAA